MNITYSKQRDLNELNSREENLKKKLNASSTEYEKKAINIDLAKLSPERVKKLAEGIVSTQKAEINYMKQLLIYQ